MALMNEVLVPDMVSGKFMSMFAATIHPVTGAVQWCNAGHPAPLLFTAADSKIHELGTCGPALGMFDDSEYDAGEPFTLRAGDAILAYTDGATEARNAKQELYGDDRVKAVVAAHAHEGPRAILDAVRQSVREFTGNAANDDDFTVLALKYGK
jgi:sigma-B regulation protein RsbU (phosphoserine phosphatase)